MLKKMKKAFTITELVIVIAVIAILAAVLIPTFTTVVNNANESAAMQEARSEFENFNVEVLTNDAQTGNDFILKYAKGDKIYYFVVENGQFNVDPISLDEGSGTGETLTYKTEPYTKLADPEEGETTGFNEFNDYKELNKYVTIYVSGTDGAATTEGAGA